jgi:hypothetical protein
LALLAMRWITKYVKLGTNTLVMQTKPLGPYACPPPQGWPHVTNFK